MKYELLELSSMELAELIDATHKEATKMREIMNPQIADLQALRELDREIQELNFMYFSKELTFY